MPQGIIKNKAVRQQLELISEYAPEKGRSLTDREIVKDL